MKKLVFCIVVVLFAAMICIGNEGMGGEDTGNESRYKFQFISDYIRSISRLKMIEKETSAFNRQHENDIQYREATVTYYRRANKELLEARDMISKYENSENQLIKSAAEAISLLYDNLSNIQLETIKMFEGLDNPEQFNIESFMEKSNELQLRRDKFLKAFNDTAVMVTYILVSWDPDESGRLSYLAISRNQRGSLIKQLSDTFGGEEGSVIQDGQTYLNSCGAVLLKVLIGEHKSSDER